MKSPYQTPARNAILGFFAAHPEEHFTAEQICAYFAAHPVCPIGKSTIYRQLSRLCEQNALRRFEEADPDTGISVHVYQNLDSDRNCDQHFHLKCRICGKVRHLDCEKTEVLLEHLLAAHGFTVDCGRSILYGVCDACAPRIPIGRPSDCANDLFIHNHDAKEYD